MPKISDAMQEQLVAARRSQILDAATHVFAEKGFHRSTIKDVAKVAQIADGTIYLYFQNKDALLLGILERINETENRASDLSQALTMDIQEFMNMYIRHRIQTLSQRGFATFQILVSAVLVNAPLRQMYMQQVVTPTYTLGEKYMHMLIEAKRIKPFDVPLMMRVLSAAVLGMLVLRAMEEPVTIQRWDDIPDVLIEILLQGLLPK